MHSNVHNPGRELIEQRKKLEAKDKMMSEIGNKLQDVWGRIDWN